MVWRGLAGLGGAWAAHGDEIFIGADLLGVVWLGLARLGVVRQGKGRMWQRNTCPCGFDGSGLKHQQEAYRWQI